MLPTPVEEFHNKQKLKNFQNNKVRKKKEKNVSTEKFEVATVDPSIIKPNLKKVLGRSTDFNEFPELKPSRGNSKRQSWQENENNKSNLQKSWLSVVDSTGRNFKEAFPKLPSKESYSKNKKNVDLGETKLDFKCLQPKISVAETRKTDVTVEAIKPENAEEKKKKNRSVTFKAVIQPHQNLKKKKRADPIFINLKEILEVDKSKKKEKQHKALKCKVEKQNNREFLSGNILDSSNPKRSRGKHREIKKKKLTNLKLAIIKERIIKQKVRENAVDAYFGKECMDLVEKIDFKVEIEKYLEESNKRRNKPSESNKNVVKKNINESNIQYKVNANKKIQDKLETKSVKTEESNNKKTSSRKASNCIAVVNKEVKFSSKLREYCDNIVTPDLNSAVTELIKALVNLQDKMFARDPIKAKARRRHVSGIKEVKKHLTLKKVKMIVIAPDLEKLQMEGSIYDLINELKSAADCEKVPCVFALDRYKLGRCVKKNVRVSAFAILNYEGLEPQFENVMQHFQEAKKQFTEMIPKPNDETEKKENSDVTSQVISSLISAFREDMHISGDKIKLESH